MKRPLLSWLIALCAVVVVTLSGGAAFADRRIALVIGNSHYKNPGLLLANPTNDADDVTAALRDLGFEVIQKNDTSKRDLDLAMAQFARMATDADAALFFYAGHALQYQGRNYLMPTDAELEDEVSLRYQMMVLDDVRAALDRASGIKIMILDACRNSPVVDRLRKQIAGATRSVENTRGLARIDKTQGMVVAYATAADDVAADGTGRNSPYTTALLKRLREPGLEIEIMFRRVASDVNAQTNGRQRPETYVSLLNEYYLNQSDNNLWQQIKDSGDPAVFRDFIERFPNSKRSFDARNRLDALQRVASDAARLLEEEKARTRVLTAEQERAEREAAQRRAQEEDRAKAAALAEREQAEREAAQRRVQEQERAKTAAAAERQRVESEAAQRRQEEQRTQLALLERQRLDREAAKRIQEQEEVERKKVEAKRRGLERESGIAVVPTTPRVEPAPQATAPAAPAAVAQAEACKRDEETLVQLRATQVRDEVLRFEKELTCARLRPQVARLRESLGGPGEVPAAPPPPQAQEPPRQQASRQEPPRQEPPRQEPSRQEPARPAPGPVLQSLEHQAVRTDPSPSQAQACKRDEERLVRLRASQSRDEVIKFAKELGCERLRPQVLRLRESLGGDDDETSQRGIDETSHRGVTVYGLDHQAAVRIDPPPASAVQDCQGDEEKLVHLRAGPVREDVIRFEQELTCERLRNQVLRLKESVGVN